MFARPQEQLACTVIGNADYGMWSRAFSGSAYRVSAQGQAQITSSSRISKRFAHTSKGLRGLCFGVVKAPARLGNPEDRP